MRAYYNEIEPFCARWLRNLIAEGLIAPGDVDERSIEGPPSRFVWSLGRLAFANGWDVLQTGQSVQRPSIRNIRCCAPFVKYPASVKGVE